MELASEVEAKEAPDGELAMASVSSSSQTAVPAAGDEAAEVDAPCRVALDDRKALDALDDGDRSFRGPRRRRSKAMFWIMFVVSSLLPLTTVIYLPSLVAIADDLNTSTALVTLTISVHARATQGCFTCTST